MEKIVDSMTSSSNELSQVPQTPILRPVLNTLAYFDVFRFPLTVREILRFSSSREMDEDNVEQVLEWLVGAHYLQRADGYYALEDVAQRLAARRQHAEEALRQMDKATEYARLIARLPFVRGVFLSGSISKGVMAEDSDIDLFFTTPRKRAWLARTVINLYTKLPPMRGAHLCLNYFIDEDNFRSIEKNRFTAI